MSNNIMTANILMKDVLKPSGWECPEALLNKTFAQAVSGSSSDVEDNKTATITANGTVEITPTSGKTSMKKVTATVAVPTVTKLYAWNNDTVTVFTTTAQPTTSSKALVGSATGITQEAITAVADEYASITVDAVVYTRKSESDITL